MSMTAGELAGLVQGDLTGDANAVITDVRTIPQAGPTDVVFAGDKAHFRKLKKCSAGVVLLGRSFADSASSLTEARAVIVVDEPQAAVVKVLEKLRPQRPRPVIGRSTLATIAPSARIGEGTNVYPGAIVGENVSIGKNCDIHSGVVLGPGATIGDDCVLFPNAVLYPDVTLGNRVILHAGVVIGSDGFGYRFVNGRHVKVPHFGTVKVEDDVEIGSNSTIDKAVIGTTLIGAGSKLDNLVMVAHNVEMGKHNVLASQVGFAGSSKSGDYCVLGGQAGVADHVTLSDRVTLGAKAAAHKDLEPGTYHGIPVLPEIEALKVVMATRKLPDMKDQIKELQEQVKALTERLAGMSEAKAA